MFLIEYLHYDLNNPLLNQVNTPLLLIKVITDDEYKV